MLRRRRKGALRVQGELPYHIGAARNAKVVHQETSAVEEEMWSVTHALWAIILQAVVQAAAALAQLNSGPGSGQVPRPASACVLKGCMPMPAAIAVHVQRQ